MSETKKVRKRIAIIGAGAAGLMAAIEAGKKGHDVQVFDHAKKPGEKIRISGGGRCNFTNKYSSAANFHGRNAHFHKSALSRYPAASFISMVERHGIAYHEKNADKNSGQLFCDGRSQEIIDMLLRECEGAHVQINLDTPIDSIDKTGKDFTLSVAGKQGRFDAVIIATGGPSIPKMGASDFGYRIARQFGHTIIPTTPALVPLTFTDELREMTKRLSGVSVDSVLVKSDSASFTDDLLFTHRGLSGPAILQISSYWSPGESIVIDLLSGGDMTQALKQGRYDTPKMKAAKFLGAYLPARVVEEIFALAGMAGEGERNLADYSDKKIAALGAIIHGWRVKPNGSEGYRTAEVTKGGVNTDEIDAKTFESRKCPSLYFIGEVLDVTGHLGGHNFQWAWASGYCCGREI